ncbi:putative immunity protein [Arthrobacter sp.]|uniref:putative immunity protein n=1 Tax=Arthrobacter sp. TaxID=1667 RepID=UPI0034E85034
MILPKVRDPRFVTIRRGGTLTEADHRLLALWAASCAEHVLGLFEAAHPGDQRPRQGIEHARAWTRGEVKMMESRAAGGHAMAAARELSGRNCRNRFANLSLMTRSCATTSAGRFLSSEAWLDQV